MNRNAAARPSARRRWWAIGPAALGLLLSAFPAAATSVPTKRAELEARVAAVREALQEARTSANSEGATDETAQWFNWPNWGNWNNWANWGNWGNWGNWFNR